MRMKISTTPSLHVLLLILTGLLGGCGAKDKVKNENVSPLGRDKVIYEDAAKKAKKGRYDEARLLYNVVITTYPDSEYLPLAKLAIADSFYLEGGTSNLEQAIGGYKEFTQYFPTHPKTCEVKHKIAQSLMRQMGAYNRDASKAKQAEFQLKAAAQSCQNSPFLEIVNRDLKTVQQVLGLHELDIAKFYFNKQAWKSTEGRLRDIINQYPEFSYYDEALYRLGVSMIEQEQPEEASEQFTRLVRDFPNSEFAGSGKEFLEKLGKPIPEPSNNDPAPLRPSFVGKFTLILGNNGLEISKDGVLLSKEGDEKKDVKDAMKPQQAAGSTGTRAIRASNKPTQDASSSNGNATNASQPASSAVLPAPQNSTAPENGEEAKSGDGKSENKNDKKKSKESKQSKEKENKKKSGI
jgi:outer membrane protein assembly factor BamD